MMHDSSDIAKVDEVAKWLDFSPKFIREHWLEIGGWIIGGQYRASWTKIRETLDNANKIKEQRRRMACQSDSGWRAGGLKNISTREKMRTGMASCQGMGRRTKSDNATGKSSLLNLREFRPLDGALPQTRMDDHE